MSSVDSRIVTMKFDNGRFNEGVANTVGALGKLKNALSFGNASKSMADVQNQADKFNMGPMEGAVTGVSKAFLALSTVAITALANITNRVVDTGIRMVKSLSMDQVIAGFQEYELKMGSIQTILANTQRYGTTLDEVSASLDELNSYADKTIYNFGDMTKNIGLFTNAGIRIEDATSMIQGFSNVAAASGTSAQGAAGAAYQLSQALSAGTIRLMDWRSLTNVGMGNKNMQDGIIQIADAMGAFEGTTIDAKTAAEDFNGSLEKKWLSADVMENYLKIMAGEVTPAQMKALGLTEKQIDMFKQQQKTAEEAATKVRTWTQLVGTVQEAIGSGWSETFNILIGDFDEATALFTEISDAIGGIVGASAESRNQLLSDWKELGGRTLLIDTIRTAFQALGSVVTTIKDAFRSVFPPMTAERLMDITKGFNQFVKSMVPSEKTLTNIGNIFKGLFSVVKIGITVIKGIGRVFGSLFRAITNGSGSFLDIAGKIGLFLTSLGEMGSLSGLIDRVFARLATSVGDAVGGFDRFLSVVKGFASTVKDVLVKAFTGLSDVFSNVFSGFKWSTLFAGIGAGGFATIGLALRKMVKEGIGINVGGGFLDGITEALEGLTGVLKGMEQNLKANALLKIAGAIALLTASIVILASIDTDDLIKAVTAMSVSFAILLGAMQVLTLIAGSKGIAKASFVAGALIALATAMLILSAAIKNLSGLSWGELLKGLVGVAGAMAIMAVAIKPLSKGSGLMRTGLGLIFVATAMRIMASAIGAMGKLSWEEIGKGLLGIAGALIVIAAGIKLMPNLLVTSVGLLILSGALNAIALAMNLFAKNDLKQIGKGLLAMGGALVVIAGALWLMPPNMPLIAAGLVGVSVALNLIAAALRSMGKMSWEEIAKGLVTLGGSLAILAIGLYAMSGTLLGAAALVVAAAALMLLVPALIALGGMTWGEIAKGLIALAGAILVIGVAAAIFGAAAPLLLLGGAALVVFGAGLTLVGIAALAFAKAIAIGVKAAGAGAETITALLKAVIKFIPKAMKAFGEGVVEFIKAIGRSHKEIVKAFSKILAAILDAVIKNIPKMRKLFDELIKTAVKVIRKWFPVFIETGLDLLLKLMKGIRDRVPAFVHLAGDIITRFLNGLSRELPRIIRAGTNLIIKFIKGVADAGPKIADAGFKAVIKLINGLTRAINNNLPKLRAAGRDLAYAIANGMTGGLLSKIGGLARTAANMARSALNAAKRVLGIDSPSKEFFKLGKFSDEGFIEGLVKYLGPVEKASENVGNTAIDTLRDAMRDISDNFDDTVDMNPVIKPVLDLTDIQKNAGALTGLITPSDIRATATYSQATSASAERSLATRQLTAAEEARAREVQFVQNNYSPKHLSAIDIYRNTRSQLSLAKEALTV